MLCFRRPQLLRSPPSASVLAKWRNIMSHQNHNSQQPHSTAGSLAAGVSEATATSSAAASGPQSAVSAGRVFECTPGQIAIGGHRGMGMNLIMHGRMWPDWRENTLESMQQAAMEGVSFVEFDVQVTSDGVPVIWHDDEVVTGTPGTTPTVRAISEIPVNEFINLASGTCSAATAVDSQVSKATAAPGIHTGATATSDAAAVMKTDPADVAIPTSDAAATPAFAASAGATAHTAVNNAGATAASDTEAAATAHVPAGSCPQLLKRFTRINSPTDIVKHETLVPWVCAHDSALPRLDAVLSGLPPGLALDIEVKMAVPDSVPVTPPEEVDRVVNPILQAVQHAHSAAVAAGQRPRTIFYSSFDPDVCLALAARQTQHKVYFLSGCGAYEHSDPRRTSIDAALEFASRNGLAGVVLPAKILLANKDMASRAHALGLGLMTYGLEDSLPPCVAEQCKLGVQAAIVDNVPAIVAAFGRV